MDFSGLATQIIGFILTMRNVNFQVEIAFVGTNKVLY